MPLDSRPRFALVFWAFSAVLCAAAADLTGDWNLKAFSPQGEHPSKLTLVQEAEKLTGSIGGPENRFKLEGSFKDDQIQFNVQYTGGDAPAVIPFTGRLQGGKLAGEYRAGDTLGRWSAERVP